MNIGRLCTTLCKIGVACILLSPPGAGLAAQADELRFEGVTLRVATWGGATRDALRDYVASKLEERGAKVEFVVGSPQENFAKLIASPGRPPFDLLEFLGTMKPEIAGRGLLEKLDLARIPNTRFLQPGQFNEYMIPTWNTEEMIVYNVEKFREHGLPVPQSLTDLADPRLDARVMIPDISSGGGIEAVGAFALTAGGDERNIAPGLELIGRIPNLRFWKAGGEVVTQFKSGDIWAAQAHAGWALRTARAGVPVATVAPRIGERTGLVKEGYIGAVKGTRNLAAAQFFINTYLSADAQTEFALKVGSVPVNPQALEKLAQVADIRSLVVLDADRIKDMVRLDADKIDLGQWSDQWNRMIAR